MTRIAELIAEHSQKYNELRLETSRKMREALTAKKLNGYVRRKRDNKIGVLYYDCWTNRFDFHPITKKGDISKIANGYVGVSVEDDYEPVEEVKTDDN